MAESAVTAQAPSVAAPAAARVHRLAHLLAPALIFLGVRACGVAVLAALAQLNGSSLKDKLYAWDGGWYLAVAQGGYRDLPAGMLDAFGRESASTVFAFFPGYPALVGIVDSVPLVSPLTAGVVVSLLAGVACAYGMARLGQLACGSIRAGRVLVALFAASPMGVVLSMTYPEALFCALAVWSLVLLLQRNWVAAGALCSLAGLVRPTDAALVLTVELAAAAWVVQQWRTSHDEDLGFLTRTTRDSGHGHAWRWLGPLSGMLLAPAGLLGYLYWVGTQTRPDAGFAAKFGAWSQLQETGWNTSFDFGAATARFLGKTFASPDHMMHLITAVVLVAAIVLTIITIRLKVSWVLVVYGIAVLIMVVGTQGIMATKARNLVPAFVLLIPIAIGLSKRKTSTVVLTLSAIAIASAWIGAYSLTSWKYAI